VRVDNGDASVPDKTVPVEMTVTGARLYLPVVLVED
jgi:hypothetical protein